MHHHRFLSCSLHSIFAISSFSMRKLASKSINTYLFLSPIIRLKLFQISSAISLQKVNLLKRFQDLFATFTPTRHSIYCQILCSQIILVLSFFFQPYLLPSLVHSLSLILSPSLLPSILPLCHPHFSFFLCFFLFLSSVRLWYSFEIHLETFV